MSQKPNQDAKNIGARFRSARSLVPDLNRKSFCERHGINRYTMQSWENGLHVSKGKNVERFIEALAREGVFCTAEWLIEGIGEPARPLLGINHDHNGLAFTSEPTSSSQQDEAINDLVASYQNTGLNVMTFRVPDDAMSPQFIQGDLVVGRLIKDAEKNDAHQKFCIVALSADKSVVRKVIVSKEGLILLASDPRLPTITLQKACEIYLIVCQFLSQGN